MFGGYNIIVKWGLNFFSGVPDFESLLDNAYPTIVIWVHYPKEKRSF